MDRVRVYLIVDGRGDCRLTKRRPTLDWDQVAFPISVEIPPGWGRVYDAREAVLTLPSPPEFAAPVVEGIVEPAVEDIVEAGADGRAET